MGDKIAAKAKAIELGIPVVPGSDGEVKTSDDALELARDMGFPVLVKAASGGGGRGMKIAQRGRVGRGLHHRTQRSQSRFWR